MYFNSWRRAQKISVFIGICLALSTLCIFLFIRPVYEDFQTLIYQHRLMLQQQQDQLLNAANSQKIQQQITALQWPYQTRLRQIQRRVTPAVIYTQLSYLAKAHHLQLLQLKPQKYPLVSGWNQIIFTLDLNGSEANALDFLRLSMHQTWLTQYQKIEFSSLKNRVLVHLTLAIYYVGV